MPRKTKKQKIMAEYRRKLQQLPGTPNIKPKSHPPTSMDKISLVQFAKKDLGKTIIIAGVLVALEFFIFYANLKEFVLGI